MVKVASFCPPYVGGTYTAAVRLRHQLARYGYELCCIGVEEDGVPGHLDSRQLEDGVEVWRVGTDLRDATDQVIHRLSQQGYRIVMTMPLEHVLTANLIHYVPRRFVTIVRTPMMSHAVYARVRCMAAHADRIIAISDRVAADLVQRYRIPPQQVVSIFNGLDVEQFSNGQRTPPLPGWLRVLYLGRISDLDKGVFLLPRIMCEVRRQTRKVVLDVVGEGGDVSQLRSQVEAAGLQETLRLLGPRPLQEIPALLQEYDCVVMPSRMEACGWSLLEGMASGCVPVAHHIWGSIGTIVEDGVSGFTVPVGDVRRFAQRLVQLSQDHQLLCHMSCAARARVQQRFSLQQMAEQYAQVMDDALTAPSTREPPIPLDRYRVPAVMRRTWRSHLPRPVKTLARKWMIRLGMPA